MRKLSLLLLAAALATALPARAATPLVPPGYRLAGRQDLGAGLAHLTLTHAAPAQRVHVASLTSGASFELRAVLSNDAIAGAEPRVERTSEMCRRLRCAVAVNADFYLDDGEPLGGIVSRGEILRSPNQSHHQLAIGADGSLNAGPLAWKASMVSTDLRSITVDGVNVARDAGDLVLYTPWFAPTTGTNAFGTEMVVEIVKPVGGLRLGHTAVVRIVGVRDKAGDTPIPAGGAVLSGHGRGAAALGDLWSRVQSGSAGPELLLRLESPSAVIESVGGTPILVRDGKRWFADDSTSLVRKRHPRTIVGWNRRGDVYLVTVDGRQPGVAEGMTLAEVADFMLALGATDALNLDGGGSTTFVERGEVANRPSDRTVRRRSGIAIVQEPARGDTVLGFVERPVAVALVIVPRGSRASGPDGPVPAGALALPTTVAIPAPVRSDPASNLQAGFPAVVATVPPPRGDQRDALAMVAAALAGALAAATAGAFVRRRRSPL